MHPATALEFKSYCSQFEAGRDQCADVPTDESEWIKQLERGERKAAAIELEKISAEE